MPPKKVIRKEKVSINVYTSEDGVTLYRVVEADTCGKENEYPASCCMDCGFFTEEAALEDFLEENAKDIEIVKDYRKY